ncbi:MAG: hypothetical protein K6T51_13635 [Rubrobacteraceae bacterium]|nr:hypothetical protein [Rubrobacteraceae bacterium]
MVNLYALGAAFIGTGVEMVEALTIVLAVGAVRGWRGALFGALSAALVLAALVAGVGAPLASVMGLFWVQIAVGAFLLLFGARWLRKAILRYGGLIAIHDEAESYEEERGRLEGAGEGGNLAGVDRLAFATAFGGTFLEGLEAVFIVIAFGIGSGAMPSSILGAVLAVAAVVLAGVLLRRPLTRVPENTLKFVVGVMLTSFGTFWVGEGLGVAWPQGDLSILYLAMSLLVFSWVEVRRMRRLPVLRGKRVR